MPGASFGMSAGGAYGLMGWMQGVAGQVKTNAYVDSVITFTHAALAQYFNDWLDAIARMSPREFQHVYEVPTKFHAYRETVGVPGQRLWMHTLTGSGGTRDASFKFLPSKRPVPVEPSLLDPNPRTGRAVKTGVHIFELKAEAMEYGITVQVHAKLAKMLAFPSGNVRPNFMKSVTFRAGGRVTSGKFTAAYLLFWQEQAPNYFNREILPTLARDIADQASLDKAIQLGRTTSVKNINIGASEGENYKTFQEAEALAKAKLVANQTKYINAAAARRFAIYGE